MNQTAPALDRQIGGSHYKHFAIQPVEYSHKNQLGFLAGCVVKRICRFNMPSGKGLQDLEKVIHELELLQQLNDDRYEEPPAYFTSLSSLPIQPFRFCERNQLNRLQTDIIHLVTRYNRTQGKGLEDLAYAKHLVGYLIKTHYPN